jgi:hypothetical protein
MPLLAAHQVDNLELYSRLGGSFIRKSEQTLGESTVAAFLCNLGASVAAILLWPVNDG